MTSDLQLDLACFFNTHCTQPQSQSLEASNAQGSLYRKESSRQKINTKSSYAVLTTLFFTLPFDLCCTSAANIMASVLQLQWYLQQATQRLYLARTWIRDTINHNEALPWGKKKNSVIIILWEIHVFKCQMCNLFCTVPMLLNSPEMLKIFLLFVHLPLFWMTFYIYHKDLTWPKMICEVLYRV